MGFVYFIRAAEVNRIKIGYATHAVARLTGLQAESPVLLELAGVIEGTLATERTIHARFAHLRLHNEWFRADLDLDAFILAEAKPWTEGMAKTARDERGRRAAEELRSIEAAKEARMME